jgi:UDP-glucuronate 4-epimerase
MDKQTILVTGCAGFIASSLCEKLLHQGHIIIGVDNLNDYYDTTIKKYRLQKLINNNSNFTFKFLDIENKNNVESIFNDYKFDVVYHLAARAGVKNSLINPFEYINTNIIGTTNILECMKNNNTKKLVLASTSSLYANHEPPFDEELSVNRPLTPYASTKKAAELLAYNYHYHYNIDVSVVRYFTVFGPCGRPDMSIFRFITKLDNNLPIEIYGNGEQSRDFTFIDDIVDGTILASKPLGYEILNLGGGKSPKSLNWIINFICDFRKIKNPKIQNKDFNKSDTIETRSNISKANLLIGYSPQYDVEQGLIKTLNWHTENNWWIKNIDI